MELRKSRYGLPSAEDVGVATAKALGGGDIKELRARDAVELIETSSKGGFVPLPVVDGWLLPDHSSIFMIGVSRHYVPLLVGFNAGELRSLRVLLPPIPASAADYERAGEGAIRGPERCLSEAVPELQRYGECAGSKPRRVIRVDGATPGNASRRRSGSRPISIFFSDSYLSEVPLDLQAFHASEIPFVFGQGAERKATRALAPTAGYSRSGPSRAQ